MASGEAVGPFLSVDALRVVLGRLLDQVEAQFGAEVDLAGGFYSSLDPRAAYDVSGVPKPETMLGDLVDDVETIREMVEERDPDEIHLWHDLEHVIGILGRLASLDLRDLP